MCSPCSVGNTSTAASAVCTGCPSGTRGVSGGTCTPCVLGSVSTSPPSGVCVQCQPGFRWTVNYTCDPCPNNTYIAAPGSANCMVCNNGIVNANRTICTPITSTTESATGSTSNTTGSTNTTTGGSTNTTGSVTGSTTGATNTTTAVGSTTTGSPSNPTLGSTTGATTTTTTTGSSTTTTTTTTTGGTTTGPTECPTNHFGPNCQLCACVHGTCSSGKQGNGSCTCENNWFGVNCSITLPPNLVGARFANSGQSVLVTFDRPTDQPATGLCSQIFNNTELGSAGCSWVTSTNLLVSLTQDSTLVPYQLLQLKRGVVRGLGGNTFSARGNVTVLPPTNPTPPSGTIQGPSQIGSCDPFTLTATLTGSGGRPFLVIAWKLVEHSHNSTENTLLGANSGNTVFNANSGFIAAGNTVTLQVTATNFLGQTGNITFSLTRFALPIPTVSIQSSATTIAITRNTNLFIPGSVVISSCVAASEVLWSWSIIDLSSGAQVTADVVSRNTRTLHIAPATLTPAKTYQVTLRAAYASVANQTGSATINIYVTPVPLQVVISGDTRVVPVDSPVVLDGSHSINVDYPTAILNYTWSCSLFNSTASCGTAVLAAIQRNTASAIVPVNTLQQNMTYAFTLVATSSAGASIVSGTASTMVITLAVAVPAVTITFVTPPPVSVSNKVVITGTATGAGPISYHWESIGSDLDLSNPSVVTSLPARPTLVIAAHVLTAGREYRLRLVATNPAGSSYVDALVKMASPPNGGYFVVSPVSGYTTNTTFKFLAPNWEDVDNPNSLLYYSYSYIIDGKESYLGDRSLSSSSSVSLPTPKNGNTVICVVRIYAGYGSDLYTTATFNVSVYTPVLTSTQASTFVADTLATVLTSTALYGDSSAALQQLSILGNVLQTITTPTNNITAPTNVSVSVLASSLLSGFYSIQSTQQTTPQTLNQQTSVLVSLTQSFATITPELKNKTISFLLDISSQSEQVTPATSQNIVNVLQAILVSISTDTTPRTKRAVRDDANHTSSDVHQMYNGNFDQGSAETMRKTIENIASANAASLYCGENPSLFGTDSIGVYIGKVYASDLTATSFGYNNSTGFITYPEELTALNSSIGECYGTHMFVLPKQLYFYSQNFSGIASDVVTYTLLVNGEEYVVSDLSEPVTISINYNMTLSTLNSTNTNYTFTPTCKFWNKDLGVWDGSGCYVANYTNTTVTCKCSHLTDFAVEILQAAKPLVDAGGVLTDAGDILKGTPNNTAPFVFVACILVAYIIAMIWGYKADRKQENQQNPEKLVEEESEKEKDDRKWYHKLKDRIKFRITRQHRYVAVYFRPQSDPFSRTRRVTVILCVLMTSMAANAIFYQVRHSEVKLDLKEQILTAIWAALIILPINVFVSILMRRARWNKLPPQQITLRAWNASEEGSKESPKMKSSKDNTPRKSSKDNTPRNRSRTSSVHSIHNEEPQVTDNKKEKKKGKLREFLDWLKHFLWDSELAWGWLIVGYFICFCVVGLSILFVLLYGILFPQSLLNGWLISSAISIGQDIFINQPVTNVASAVAGVLFSNAFGPLFNKISNFFSNLFRLN